MLIKDSQTNTIFVSPYLNLKKYGKTYESIEKAISETPSLRFLTLEGTKDIWCRDFMPIQIAKDKTIGYTYDPDYLKLNDNDRYYKTDNSQYPSTKRIDLIMDVVM